MTRTFKTNLALITVSTFIVLASLFSVRVFAETPTFLTDEEKQKVLNQAETVSKEFGASILRLENIINRLQSRLAQLENENADTSLAQAKLDEAKRELESARTVFAMLNIVDAAADSGSPREKFAVVRARYMIIRGSLSETHDLLTEAVTLSREALQRAEAERKMTEAFKTAPAE